MTEQSGEWQCLEEILSWGGVYFFVCIGRKLKMLSAGYIVCNLNTVFLINTDSKSGQEQTQVVSGDFCQVSSNAPGLVAILSILKRASRLQMKCSRHCSGFIKGSLIFWSRHAGCNIIRSFSVQSSPAENWVAVVVGMKGSWFQFQKLPREPTS